MVSRQLLDPNLIQQMSQADPRAEGDSMPLLLLNHAHKDEVLLLEEQLLSQVKDKKWMNETQIQEASSRLAELRSTIPMATLLNGHHRIRAIMRVGDSLLTEHHELLGRVRQGPVTGEELQISMQSIQRRAKMATYRVEVFDSKSAPPS